MNRNLPSLEISSISNSTAVVFALYREVHGDEKLIVFRGIFLNTVRILLSSLLPFVKSFGKKKQEKFFQMSKES